MMLNVDRMTGFGVLAGDTFAGEDALWAKQKSLREGADIASKRLWD